MKKERVRDMTVREAVEVLQHPVFGDPDCIEARDLLALKERVRVAREARGWHHPVPGYLNALELREELNLYERSGYEEEA